MSGNGFISMVNPPKEINPAPHISGVEYNSEPSMPDIDIKSFRSGFDGQVYEPADAGFDDARRIWNASVSKHPKVIARCSGLADVIAAVNFGRANHLLTAIRGGGHNVAGFGTCDGGMVIDLSPMKDIAVDAAS